MLHTGFEIFHVGWGKRLGVQTRGSRVELLHRSAKIVHQRTAFACEIGNASFSRAADMRVWRQKSLRLPGRHHYVYEPIAQQTGTSDAKFAPFRNLNVIINL